jgi:hypothetical protein
MTGFLFMPETSNRWFYWIFTLNQVPFGTAPFTLKIPSPLPPLPLIAGELSHQQAEEVSAGFLLFGDALLGTGLLCFILTGMVKVISNDAFYTLGKHQTGII